MYAKQLAARAGQVRCGKCSRVFNAIEHLVDETSSAFEPWPAGEPTAHHADASAAEPREPSAIPESADTGVHEDAPALPETADAAEAKPSIPEPAITAGADDEPSLPAAAVPISAPSVLSPSASSYDFGLLAAADPERRARRWPWLLGTLLMSAVLLAQTAYYFRGTITLLFPETKPYATALCAKLGCEVPLPRRVDLMSIEASDLQADTTNPNVIVLTATIKNRAVFNQQHPFLELTLTDGQDQPLVRRVLTPKDYLGNSFNAQVGVAANGEIAIKVIVEGSQLKATGYRLYLFYP